MACKQRIHFPGALYHVILRGNAQQEIFFEDGDRYRFYLLLQTIVEKFGCRIAGRMELVKQALMNMETPKA
jgi:REP element-mobilizing transposase RayT